MTSHKFFDSVCQFVTLLSVLRVIINTKTFIFHLKRFDIIFILPTSLNSKATVTICLRKTKSFVNL